MRIDIPDESYLVGIKTYSTNSQVDVMFQKAKLSAALAGATLAATLASPAALAAEGTVDVDITFPPLVILYYYDDIAITVGSSEFGDALIDANAELGTDCTEVGGTDAEFECAPNSTTVNLTTADGSFAAGELTYDADIANDANIPSSLSTVITVTLENVWAVRALTDGTLDASVSDNGVLFENSSISPETPTASLTLGAGNVGDVSFEVDLSDDLTGLSVSDSLTITVVSVP